MHETMTAAPTTGGLMSVADECRAHGIHPVLYRFICATILNDPCEKVSITWATDRAKTARVLEHLARVDPGKQFHDRPRRPRRRRDEAVVTVSQLPATVS